MKVTLLGKERLLAQLKSIPDEVDAAVESTLKKVGNEFRDDLREAMPEGGGVASEPGAAPHSQTGNLKKNIFAKLMPKLLGKELLLTVGIYSDAFYGYMLEYGAANYPKGFKREHKKVSSKNMAARSGVRLMPRPWFWRVLEKFWAESPAAVETAVNKVMRKYAS